MVFTYKGQDIADTILRFAKEYRVGHIVIGSPERLPIWKRLLGRKNIVERLIDQARGINVVVLDTHKETAPEAATAKPIKFEASTQETAVVHDHRLVLSSLLSTDTILLWDNPVAKEMALRELVDSIKGVAVDDPKTVLIQLLKREEQSSTFLNEGVAFPHFRIEGLPKPAVSLGIAKKGISDLSTDQPVNLIFLLLSPKEQPGLQIYLLSLTARAARSRHLLQDLLYSSDATEALASIRQWETLSENSQESR
jgi:two-component system sensor histidine kinase KdpD